MVDETEFKYVRATGDVHGDEDKNNHEFTKTIGFALIFILALNYIFDSSIFYIPPMGYALSGPSSIIAWILLIGIAIYVAMCFAEVMSIFPTTGGIYEVSKRAYGSFISFITGWITWMAGNFVVLAAFTAGLETLYPATTVTAYAIKLGIAVGTVLLFSYLALQGKDIGLRTMAYSTVLILIVFAILVFSTFIDVSALIESSTLTTKMTFDNFSPFFKSESVFGNMGFLLATFFIIATTFFGLEAVTFLSGEVKDARKVIPKVLIWVTVIVMIVTTLFVIGSVAILDQTTYATSAQFFQDIILKSMGNHWAWLAAFAVFMSGLLYFAEGFGWILSGPRLIFAIAKDDMFPTSFAKMDLEHGTPYKAIKFQGFMLIIGLIACYLLYMFTDYDPFLITHHQFVFMAMILIIFLLIAIPILRRKYPDEERPYKVPLAHVVPYLLSLFFLIVIGFWIWLDNGLKTLFIALVLFAIGIPVYMFLLFYFDPDVFIKFKKTFTLFGIVYEILLFTEAVRELIFDKMGEIEGKNVLLFGCGYGTITTHVAKKVGKNGKVFVTDASHKTIKKVHEKAKKEGHEHVSVLHDEHHVNRIHPAVPQVDAVLSVGVLHHIQDLRKILKEIHQRLPDGGKVVFKDEIDILKVLPNGGWAANPEKILDVLKEEGFGVQMHIKKGILVNHLIIYAIKSEDNVPII